MTRLNVTAPIMFTSDLAPDREGPEYFKNLTRFHEEPEEFPMPFARAWFKLIPPRTWGRIARYLGNRLPSEELIWARTRIPAVTAFCGCVMTRTLHR